MYKSFTALMAMASMATAAPFAARQEEARKLVIGGPGQILTADFTGDNFKITGFYNQSGAAPSWLLPQKPDLLYAVNENANDLNLFTLGDASAGLTLQDTVQGLAGVVSLAFNADSTRIVGASYGTGKYDVWEVQPDSKLKHSKTVEVTGPLGPDQESHRPHQALLDPSGRYFVIPDLGGDAILVVDTEADYNIVGTTSTGSGSGPRHGGFVSVNGGKEASHYIVATELSNELILFSLEYGTEGGLKFTEIQRLSTYGPGFPPATPDKAAAGELAIANNGRDVYVSNRLSGNATDSIAHFVLEKGSEGSNNPELRFVHTVSSGGVLPRMFSLSTDADQGLVFVANQAGDLGIAALKRDPQTGELQESPVASLPIADVTAPEFAGQENVGPQFIQQI